MKHLLTTITAALMIVGAAHAQVPSMDPPEEIMNLKWMVGDWSAQGKFDMMGTASDTKVTMTNSFDGQFLKSVSSFDFGTFKMDETQYMGWNAAKSQYSSWAFANMSPEPRIEHGKMTGDTLVMTSEPWQGTTGRVTLTKVSDTKMKFTLEFQNGEKWEKATDMEFTKKV